MKEQILEYQQVQKKWKVNDLVAQSRIQSAEKELQESALKAPFRWVVLDDDPTGTQTVHDLPVYTDWEKSTFLKAFTDSDKMFYCLTNSRGMTGEQTEHVHRELMKNLYEAADEKNVSFQIISRSDSTLRGHFPLETDILAQCIQKHDGTAPDGLVMAPFFYAGGRFTIEDVHYVKQKETLVPAAQTEFAKDQTFGFSHSWLPAYIEEKTKGRIKADQVLSISLDMLRQGDVDAAEQIFLKAKPGTPIIINALDPQDIRVAAAALYRSLQKGKRFVYRTAADFVKAVGAISDKPLLSREDMLGDGAVSKHGGVVVVGSHTKKTTKQLEALRSLSSLHFISFDSDKVLTGKLKDEAKRVRELVEKDIEQGFTSVFYTNRKELKVVGDTKEQALERSVAISDALVSVIADLQVRPAFVVAKGGITSSDVGTKALNVHRAWVLGQVQPGIPVWKCGEESKFPGVPFVIFPGNVGEEDTLLKVVKQLVR